MSVYSDWRCGAVSDEEYNTAWNFSRGEDHGEDPFEDEGPDRPCESCEYYKDGECQLAECIEDFE